MGGVALSELRAFGRRRLVVLDGECKHFKKSWGLIEQPELVGWKLKRQERRRPESIDWLDILYTCFETTWAKQRIIVSPSKE